MSKRATLLGIIAFLAFIGFVVYSSTHLATYSCEVCMEFNGLTNCATASGTTEMEARGTAISTACAPITAGVTEGIACSNTPPKSISCSEK